MHRIDGPGNVGGSFSVGDEDQGILATEMTDSWANAVQEEVCAVIESTGLGLDKADNQQLLQAIQTMLAAVMVPTGTVIWRAVNLAPVGYLACDGRLLSRVTYANLFAVIGATYGAGDGSTTFQLPDLRGEFIRGFDGGRGVDSGRAFGTSQSASTPDHYHGTGDFRNENNDDWYGILRNWVGSFYSRWVAGESGQNQTATIIGGDGETRYTGTTNQILLDESETRPRNIALLACIKY